MLLFSRHRHRDGDWRCTEESDGSEDSPDSEPLEARASASEDSDARLTRALEHWKWLRGGTLSGMQRLPLAVPCHSAIMMRPAVPVARGAVCTAHTVTAVTRREA
jgi:hypothetical protein